MLGFVFSAPGLRAQMPGQDDEVPGRIIVVKFEGNRQISSDELASIISTKATGFLSSALYWATIHVAGSPYQTVDYTKLERDTAAIAAHY